MQLNSPTATARGLAQIVRTGWCREVTVEGWDSRLVRSLLTSRAQLVRLRVDLANQIRSVLKPFGLVAGKGGGRPFAKQVRSLAANGPLREIAETLLAAWQAIKEPSQESAELVGAMIFLASAAASFITGQVLFVDGGSVAG